MARIEVSIEIQRPADRVFAFTTEANSWPKWQTFISEASQTSQGAIGIGSTFKGVVRMMGLGMKWTAESTEYEPNTKWSKNITCSGMRIAEQMNYQPMKEGIKFTITYDMKIGGFMKLFSPMIIRTTRKETVKSLAKLKDILEGQT
jgi:uncharacterized membrane protein